jgi:two-component system sensor histidine kinase KdpD
VLAVLGFNFYFLPPVGKFTIQDPQNLVAFLAFLVTAVTASQLSARARRRTAEAEARRLEIERLYALVRSLALAGNPRKTIREFLNRVVQEFGAAARRSLPALRTRSCAPARRASRFRTTI